MADLNIAEIPYENGKIHFRYSRYLSNDGTRWIRHGRFTAYHLNGSLASEGEYNNGVEHGLWRDYHDNANLPPKDYTKTGSKRAPGNTGTQTVPTADKVIYRSTWCGWQRIG